MGTRAVRMAPAVALLVCSFFLLGAAAKSCGCASAAAGTVTIDAAGKPKKKRKDCSPSRKPPKKKKQGDKSKCGSRPRHIAGYTNHARDEMAKHDVTEDQVQEVIGSRNARARLQVDCTWQTSKGGITVVINKAAWIVTVWN